MAKTNEEYLKGMKEAREKWIYENNLDFDKIVQDENCDLPRIAMALEIIAETLIEVNDNIEHIGNELSISKNLR